MGDFITRFLLCNIFISGIIGILLLAKRILKYHLTSRMQYNLWFLLLFLLAVPFLPLQSVKLTQAFSWLNIFRHLSFSNAGSTITETAASTPSGTTDWMNDFALSVSGQASPSIGLILSTVWIAGILAMAILAAKSIFRLNTLKRSALPLQNEEIRRLYEKCLDELNITAAIPVCSTAFLKSPVIVGLLKPCIYLPIHLISDSRLTDIRYMLLHELQHYKHKDALPNQLMNLAGIFYWFNPLVWYAFREMRNDREVACDASVLAILDEDSFLDYGSTLINLAEKISLTPFPFASGLSGNTKQIRRRIINIASYQPETKSRKIKSICCYFLIACILLGFVPMLPANAAAEDTYQMQDHSNSVFDIDVSSYFTGYQGCFVLLDSSKEHWRIYNETAAKQRISPDSTYKIYSALMGLEHGFITPDSTDMKWNGDENPFSEWNSDQDLTTALGNSVNWYFQSLDKKAGLQALKEFYTDIDYGNHDLSAGVSNFWAESSLKISPVEQVEMLRRFDTNDFAFEENNVQAVKNALLLSSNDSGRLYGKTGTGNINGKNVNGWFIGYVKTADTTYYFAANIQNDTAAAGSMASEITLKLLHDLHIFS